MNLLFLGGSITDCHHSFDPENLGNGYVRMISNALSPSDPELKISNKGIDGFTAARVNGMWKSLPDQEKERYDIVTVLVGINDLGMWMEKGTSRNTADQSLEAFLATYQELICDILDFCIPKLILMEPFLFDRPAQYQLWMPYLTRMNQGIRALAFQYGVSWVPLQQRLSREAGRLGTDRVTVDGIHLTEEGHKILARAWLEEAGLSVE